MLGSLDGNKPEVDEWLELDIGSRLESMQEQLELLVVPLGLDLDNVVEVALLVGLKGDIHFDRQTGSQGTLHVVLDLELGGLGTRELEPPHSLADVADGHSHLVVLVGLDICVD